MLELPEGITIAKQFNDTIQGKVIQYAKANQSPHSFTWYTGNPDEYSDILQGKRIGTARAYGGMVEIDASDYKILIGDGATPRYFNEKTKAPKKNQLYLEFEDGSVITVTVQMYGGIWVYQTGTNENPYYQAAAEKPSPLTDAFSYEYFCGLRKEETLKLSAKAFLATEQRIPGLGNGVLQDILYKAGIHPKRKMADVTEAEFKQLFHSVKDTLFEMTEKGGRDTEKDLYGKAGGYQTFLSKKTLWSPCPVCGYELHKGTFLGGTIYYCEHCQK